MVVIRRSEHTRRPAFEVDVCPDRERVIVCPHGEVDLTSAREFEQTTIDLIDRGFRSVVIDLRRVTFFDSSGIRALVSVHNRAREASAELRVILGPPASRLALETSGMTGYLNIEAPSGDGSATWR